MGRSNRTFPLAILAVPLLAACQQPSVGKTDVVQSQPLSQSLPVKNGDTALGRQALVSGDLAVAKTAFSAALRKDPSDAQAALGLAEAHLALNEIQAARQIFQALATKAPSLSARVNQGLGLIALRLGRSDQAVGLLGKSVQQDDSLWRAWLGLGQAHDRLKQPSAARRAFNAAERVAPVRAPVLNDLGMSYVSQKQPQKALEFFERALSLDPGYEIARANIRIANAMTGRYEDAISGASQTQLPDVLNNVGYIAILNKDFEVADQYLRRAIDLSAVYHKAAIANLDLLVRMSGGGAPARQTAAAEVAEDAQVVLAPATSNSAPQTVNPKIETTDTRRADTPPDAVARAATREASSAEELAALASPVVTSTRQNPRRDETQQMKAPTRDRAFRWEQTPSTPKKQPQSKNAVPITLAEEQPARRSERTFKWDQREDEIPIETADVTATEPVKEARLENLDRRFKWEESSVPISEQPILSDNIPTEALPESTEPTESRSIETKELRAPLLVDGLGSASPSNQKGMTILPPSNRGNSLERKSN